MTTYYQKLKSPQWQRKRLEILNERGFLCESCCDDSTQLHVHHKIYKKGLDPWDYPDYNYVVLCEDCHKDAHSTIDKMNELIGLLPIDGYFTQQYVYDFLIGFLDADEGWETATENQYEKFQDLTRDEFDSFMFCIGLLARNIMPYGMGKISFKNGMLDCNLSEIHLCNLFTMMALRCSKIELSKINEIRKILGGREI